MQGKPEAVKAKLQQDLLPAVKVNWILWIPAQFINFKFVPPNLRVRARLPNARSSLPGNCAPSISHAYVRRTCVLKSACALRVAGAGGQCHRTHLECVHVIPEPQDSGALACMARRRWRWHRCQAPIVHGACRSRLNLHYTWSGQRRSHWAVSSSDPVVHAYKDPCLDVAITCLTTQY